MLSAMTPVFVLAACLIAASGANENVADEEPFHLSPHVDLKRISKKPDEIDTANSIAREQQVLPENLLDIPGKRDFDDSIKSPHGRSHLRSRPRFSSSGLNFVKDDFQKDSREKSTLTPGKQRGYGYPFLIAPTLPPSFRPSPDDYDTPPKSKLPDVRLPSIPQMPAMPEMPKLPGEGEKSSKGGTPYLKKRKDTDFDDELEDSKYAAPVTRRYGIYKQPSYRNFFDLDTSPHSLSYDGRRIEYGPYSPPPSSYHHTSGGSSRPPTSPRDPYLSPSDEPVDGFYPKVYKSNGVSISHSSYGKKDGFFSSPYDSSPGRDYGDSSEDYPPPPSSQHDDFRLGHGGYVKSHKYNGNSGSYSGSPPRGPSDSGSYGSGYSSSIRDSPIVGETRKRLLDYTGARDIYEGEPDYLKDAARKPKFSHIQDDYYPYGRGGSFGGYSDFHFDESRRQPSRIKRSTAGGDDVPGCAKNSTIALCLTDADYPAAEMKNAVAKNIQYILQLSGATIEVTEGKIKAPESLKDLEKTQDLCSSSKGDVYPLRARDVEGVWRIVVNMDGVQQSVAMNICGAPGSTCDFLPSAIPSRCFQKHSAVSLLTFDPKSHHLDTQEFPMPTACACSVGRPIRIRT